MEGPRRACAKGGDVMFEIVETPKPYFTRIARVERDY
jgi:hypothetical protein